jgi:subfamily B ATP-binding cassette protein MsbA
MANDTRSPAPDPSRERRRIRTWPLFRRLFQRVQPYRGRFLAGLACNALFGVWAGALIPAVKYSIDFLKNNHVTLTDAQILGAAAVMPAYFAVRALLDYLSKYCMSWVGLHVLFDLRTELFAHLQRLSLDYFHHEKAGTIIQRVMQRTKFAQQSLITVMSDVFQQPLAIIGVVAMMLHTEPRFTLLAFAAAPLSVIPSFLIAKRIRARGRAEDRNEGQSVNILHENLGGVRVVKSYAREELEVSRFRAAARKEYENSIRTRRLLELGGPSVEIISSLGFGAAIIYAFKTQMPLEDLTGLFAGLFMLYAPFKALSKLNVQINRMTTALESLFDLLDTPPSITAPTNPQPLAPVRGTLALEGVTFKYPKRTRPDRDDDGGADDEASAAPAPESKPGKGKGARPALQGVSITFEAGKYYALVGPSGAGKSSLFNLLLRFYDPQEGRITLDGRDVRTIALPELRGAIGLVSQDTFLFHDSIKANIRYGRPDASMEEVKRAAARAHADEFIRRQKDGYDTIVGDKGGRLSGGQAQRVSLARAFLKDAPILLLDEATSALDAESAARVQEALEEFCRGRTVIAIAHRLSTVQRADEILVLDGGSITARGTHRALLESDPLYRRLCELQFG